MNANAALNPPRLWPVKLPFAIRWSWLAGEIERKESEIDFCALLRHFAPAEYRRERPNTQLNAYVRLIDWLGERIPMLAADEAERWGRDALAEGGVLGWDGIPVYAQGVEDEDMNSPAIAALMTVFKSGGYIQDTFAPYTAMAAGWGIALPLDMNHLVKPPRRKRWVKPWGGLCDLLEWINHDTEYDWLNFTEEDMGYSQNPSWNKDEIQGLLDTWERCQPVLERAMTFRAWVDEQPQERLPLMGRVLLNDPAAMAAITEPKR